MDPISRKESSMRIAGSLKGGLEPKAVPLKVVIGIGYPMELQSANREASWQTPTIGEAQDLNEIERSTNPAKNIYNQQPLRME